MAKIIRNISKNASEHTERISCSAFGVKPTVHLVKPPKQQKPYNEQQQKHILEQENLAILQYKQAKSIFNKTPHSIIVPGRYHDCVFGIVTCTHLSTKPDINFDNKSLLELHENYYIKGKDGIIIYFTFVCCEI